MAAYPPCAVVSNLVREFFPRRGLALAGVGPPARGEGAPEGGAPPAAPPDDSRVVGDMERLGYVRLDAVRGAPRGRRDRVVVLVLDGGGKYSRHAPDLEALLGSVAGERGAVERLDEVFVVAEEAFFANKNLLRLALADTLSARVGGHAPAGGAGAGAPAGPPLSGPAEDPADPEGRRCFHTALPYRNFVLVVPDHVSVPPHRILSLEEQARVLREGRLARGDLPVIFANDPPLVWAGARAGQVVEITVDSLTAGVAIIHRRVEAASYDDPRPKKGKKKAARE